MFGIGATLNQKLQNLNTIIISRIGNGKIQGRLTETKLQSLHNIRIKSQQ